MSKQVGKLFIRSLTPLSRSITRSSTAQVKLTESDVEEIEIPVPWGHIAGKWWGNKNIPPVVAVHGWQDNANSFDRLIPLLNLPSVVAIDLPGHGLSSHLPEGATHDFGEHIVLLHRIKNHFNLKQMPLITHSLGGAIGYSYASVFPEAVKWLINLECGRSLLTLFRKNLHTSLSLGIDALLKIEQQKKFASVPVYKLYKMIEMSIEGSLGSITTPEAALIVLKRGIYEVEKPSVEAEDKSSTDLEDFISREKEAIMLLSEEEREFATKIYFKLLENVKKAKKELKNFHLDGGDKFFAFKRDPSIKVLVFQSMSEEFIIEASKNIKCPVLSVRAKQGFLFGSTRKLYETTLENLKINSNYFEHHDVDGTHYVHLNTPESVAVVINNFVKNINDQELNKEWKWWGPKNQQPILCLHGWQDNANTFNTLIPRLSADFSYLAIDLPGQGHSSHYPKGLYYKNYEAPITIRRVQLYFKWNKVFLLGHSNGAIGSFLFSSVFPNDVKFLIAIDNIKPASKDFSKEKPSDVIEKFLLNDVRDSSTAPAYSKDDLVKRWLKGAGNSLTEDSCKILMERGTIESNGLFKLSRDVKIKRSLDVGFSHQEILNLAKSVTCKILFIRAKNSLKFEKEEYTLDVMNILKERVKYFEEHTLDGTHHLHLNNPEVVAPVINSFLKKFGKFG